jgi:hypothetical protein
MTARLNISHIIDRCNEAHDGKYSYAKVVYKNAHTRVCVICPLHGEFLININNHLYNKKGCRLCANAKLAAEHLSNTQEFVVKAIVVHGSNFDYSKVNYVSATDKVEIVCPQHESFWQIPSGHLAGKGCPRCFFDTRTKLFVTDTLDFIDKANQIHEFYYDYTSTVFTMVSESVNIICPKHGLFSQRASSHLKGCGCQLCAKSCVSKVEGEWLDSLGIGNEQRQKTIRLNDKTYRVDAYDAVNNIIYEFYGDFWHGNPEIYHPDDINNVCHKTFGELYDYTINREIMLKQAGYTMFIIWERDYYNRKNG